MSNQSPAFWAPQQTLIPAETRSNRKRVPQFKVSWNYTLTILQETMNNTEPYIRKNDIGVNIARPLNKKRADNTQESATEKPG